MALRLHSPYLPGTFAWLRGNLHAHTTRSDGSRSPQEVVDDYVSRGYDFLMLSDHDCFTDPQTVDPRGMLLLPGNEISKNGVHLLHVGCSAVVSPHAERQKVLDAIAQAGNFAVMCHPNWLSYRDHCSLATLQELEGYAGIEIYNGLIRYLPGSPLATDRWDMLLSEGRRVWGFANDDAHHEGQAELAWNVVQVEELSVTGLIDSLAHGRFYASTGVEIEHIGVCGLNVAIKTRNASRITAIVDGSRRVLQVDARALSYRIPDDAPHSFIRFECWGQGEEMAWTQPLFLSSDADY